MSYEEKGGRGRAVDAPTPAYRGALMRALGGLLLAVSLLAGTPTPAALADADTTVPTAPTKLPPGYTMEQRGEVRFTYPTRAAELTETLMDATPEIWASLARDFGAELDDALDIRIAVNPDDMRVLARRPLPGYASGVAFPPEGVVLLSLTAPGTWLRPDMRQLLTHELAHVALHRAVNGRPTPRWFTEGVAIHAAGENNIARIRTLWSGAVQRRLLHLEELSRSFPAEHGGVDLAYAQSADLVRYMLEGQDERARFRKLIAKLRDGERFEAAVAGAYHVSLGYLEREWRNQLQRRFGRWPSVLIGLTGVWALAALALVFGYIRSRRRHHRTLRRWAAQEAVVDAEADTITLPRPLTPAAATVQPPAPPARPQPPQAPQSAVDRLIERASVVAEKDPEVPTVQHEGRNHTLH